MLTDELTAHYQAVLKDLITRRSEHQRAVSEHQRGIRDLDPIISSISRMLQGEPGTHPIVQAQAATPVAAKTPNPIGGHGHRYATISTRWAILDSLDRASGPMSVSDIAEALLADGIPTKAANFANNVSAVLSDMKSSRGEADTKDGKWEITSNGRSAINHIRASRRIMTDAKDSVRAETPSTGAHGVAH